LLILSILQQEVSAHVTFHWFNRIETTYFCKRNRTDIKVLKTKAYKTTVSVEHLVSSWICLMCCKMCAAQRLFTEPITGGWVKCNEIKWITTQRASNLYMTEKGLWLKPVILSKMWVKGWSSQNRLNKTLS
jgi:hypothetical protein